MGYVFVFSVWTQKDRSCNDMSHIVMDMDENNECGETYHYIDQSGQMQQTSADWTWYPCTKSGKRKCIHISSRCDQHPHPSCVYEKDGMKFAEDEDNCISEYKEKGFVPQVINYRVMSCYLVFSLVGAAYSFKKRCSKSETNS